MIECPACREMIPLDSIGACLLDGEDEIICHHCGAHLAVSLEIMSR
jgi:hypothetical protein